MEAQDISSTPQLLGMLCMGIQSYSTLYLVRSDYRSGRRPQSLLGHECEIRTITASDEGAELNDVVRVRDQQGLH
jgi:hypothetical protein